MSVGSSYWDWTWTHGTSSVIPSRGSTSLQVSDSWSSCSLRERGKKTCLQLKQIEDKNIDICIYRQKKYRFIDRDRQTSTESKIRIVLCDEGRQEAKDTTTPSITTHRDSYEIFNPGKARYFIPYFSLYKYQFVSPPETL